VSARGSAGALYSQARRKDLPAGADFLADRRDELLPDRAGGSLKAKQSLVYKLQNAAIHLARQQLEASGALDPWSGLEQVRDMAAELNLGVRSISSLNIEQRIRRCDLHVLTILKTSK
jgi:hypothetical protein